MTTSVGGTARPARKDCPSGSACWDATRPFGLLQFAKQFLRRTAPVQDRRLRLGKRSADATC